MAHLFYAISLSLIALVSLAALVWLPALWALLILVPLFLLGVRDSLQKRRAVLRNFPLVGHFRYLLEMIRPEINQYFIESNTDGTPFSRNYRSLAYQRAKRELQTLPFGTQTDVYQPGYEWMNHSMAAQIPKYEEPRIRVGEGRCEQPYDASLLNISAMSFGSMSAAAILALNGGAREGGFYHNTGEGSISRYHEEPGGHLVWQIGTGYFGCRNRDGTFNPQSFQERSRIPSVKMIEVKLSQGAKPGHGGILPAEKITPEIAKIRDVPLDEDVISPPAHSAFSTPTELLQFLAELRKLSAGKPVGIKLCLGHPAEFLSLCMAMEATQLVPDFIVVDGGEGGTGAAPLEFSNSIGCPLTEGLVAVHNALTGFGLRDQVKVVASGKILTGFNLASRLAAGADFCNAARSFMFALGCIQARRCNANVCPVGVATQDPHLVRGLVVKDKSIRVTQYHEETIHAFLELLGAAGLQHPDQLQPWHIQKRISQTQVRSYAEIFQYLEPGDLLRQPLPERWEAWMRMASVESFQPETVHLRRF
jgi:glutamate synthase domain-containing protein 2